MPRDPIAPPLPPPDDADAAMCVLASGSGGNCTLLSLGPAEDRYAVMIDAGITPRKTWRELKDRGLGPARLDAVLLTHLDQDHWNRGWARSLPRHVPVYMHRRHIRRAERSGGLSKYTLAFDEAFDTRRGLRVEPLMMAHDEHGVAAFRMTLPNGCTLGFATDLGAINDALIEHLHGVDVLAIESNYCPEMQRASDRPAFLKERIMGGAGHLSNEECAEAVTRIEPREHAVFLHLSRQCNKPELVADLHAGAEYAVTIASQHEATRWIRLEPSSSPATPMQASADSVEASLFDIASDEPVRGGEDVHACAPQQP
ncbi:MAG: MBL fold metallo-hydrolase [Planctomycetota bacterium]